jgi:YidC/Oxa1 family membrane protein insertase
VRFSSTSAPTAELATPTAGPALPPEGVSAALDAAAAAANLPYATQVAPDSWYITHRMMEGLEYLHLAGGLEWWQTILALTAGIRVLSFPLTLYSMRNSAALARVKPESDELMARAAALDMKTADGQRKHAKIRTELFKLYADNKCSPFYNLGPILLQLPVFVFMFSALQAMSSHKTGHPWQGFESGGIGWFVDLSVPDPLYVLPVAASATFLVTTLLQDPTMVASQEQAKTMQYAGIGMSVVFLPIMATTSSATVLYFAATNVVGVCQTALLRSKTFRKLVSLPTTPPGQKADELPPQPVKVQFYTPSKPLERSKRSRSAAKPAESEPAGGR